MSLKTLLSAILFAGYLAIPLRAQNPAEISPPELSMSDQGVLIKYRILQASKQDLFTVSVYITKASGQVIPAKTLRGDLGKSISGAGTKTILWDIAADSIFLDEEIFVEIRALPEKVAATAPDPKEETAQEESSPMQEKDVLSRSSLMLNSLIFPGWGLSKYSSKPHWIKGIAAYGCLAGSVAMNRYAYATYQNYLDPEHPDDKVNTYNDADTRLTVSKALGYTALAIWVVDLGWTFIGTAPGKAMQVSAKLDPLSGAPMMHFSYRF